MTMDIKPYPLKFEPIFKERIWGGQRLQSHFGKDLPNGPVGECWELADLPQDQSVIANGPWAGRTLADILDEAPEAITGNPNFKGPFPLLIKLLDAQDLLSVQVHPDQGTCNRTGHGDPKTECWYIIAADPGAFIYKGIKPGTTQEAFAAACTTGTVEDYLDKIPVQPGECHYLPSGTVHAIGSGLLIAEIQQPSDTTYRVFDYNRVDNQGCPRELHIAEALESIHYDVSAQDLPVTQSGRLVNSPFFTVDFVEANPNQSMACPSGLSVLLIIKGDGELTDGKDTLPVRAGECVLLPASRQFHLRNTTYLSYLATTIPQD